MLEIIKKQKIVLKTHLLSKIFRFHNPCYFSSQPMVFFRSVSKLSSYLVRVKLCPLERRVGSYKCRCNLCRVCHSITESDMFICNNDQRSYKINHSFDCNEKCLIYLLICNCYQKQYVGQTVNIFRNR